MSLTIQPVVDPRSDPATAQPPAERWLESMYGIRPGASSRRTSVLMNHRHAPAVAGWLQRMWGL